MKSAWGKKVFSGEIFSLSAMQFATPYAAYPLHVTVVLLANRKCISVSFAGCAISLRSAQSCSILRFNCETIKNYVAFRWARVVVAVVVGVAAAAAAADVAAAAAATSSNAAKF